MASLFRKTDFYFRYMDKINTANWSNYFGRADVQTLYSGARYTEYNLCFDEPGLAAGCFKNISTPGMLLGELILETGKPFRLLDTEPKETVESVFVLKGEVESRFYNLKKPLQFSPQNHNLQYNTSFTGEHTIHSGGFHAITITYELDWLKALVQSGNEGPLQLLSRSLDRKTNFLATTHSLQWPGRITELIHAIRHCVFTGATKYIFIESKMMELFVLQMEQVHNCNKGLVGEKWRPADKEKLYAVKEFIEHAYLEPLSLKQLTYQFGLNEFKLKKGYRHFFQHSVFGHIHELRMQHAKELLRDQRVNVTEVAYFIGYNNVSSFSYEFKKRYGCSPGRYHSIID